MSTQIGMLCAQCEEVLNGQDDIFGTSCGHLYHFLCLRQCHGQSTNCSQCDSYKPSMFKMFLKFGKATQPLSWEDQMKTIELHNELQECKSVLFCMEEKHKFSQETVQKLEGKLKKLNDALISKDCTVADLEDRILTLEQLNNFLTTEKASNDQQLEESEDQNWNISKNKFKNLNKKMKALKTQLETEVANNVELVKEINKLKELIQISNNGKNPPEFISKNKETNQHLKNDDKTAQRSFNCNELKSKSKEINVNSKENGKIQPQKVESMYSKENGKIHPQKVEPMSSNENGKINPMKSELTDDYYKVSIGNFPKKDLKEPLEQVIISIASKMDIELQPEEIAKVFKINKNYHEVTLFVIFENIYLMKKFLSRKNHLKKYSDTKCLEICAEQS